VDSMTAMNEREPDIVEPGEEGLSEEAQRELTVEIDGQNVGAILEGPSYEDLIESALEQLFNRTAILERVLVSVIQIVSENSLNPATMAERLNELLAPQETEAHPSDGQDDERSEYFPEGN
jgi:SHS2 domain-containing protein